MATGSGANGNSVGHSSLDSTEICPPGVRPNVRMKSNFKFLKTATVGLHHIGQGFQGYFCFEEITSFAKIYISNLGIVTVSDSKFRQILKEVRV
jgi:hypothetical protein